MDSGVLGTSGGVSSHAPTIRSDAVPLDPTVVRGAVPEFPLATPYNPPSPPPFVPSGTAVITGNATATETVVVVASDSWRRYGRLPRAVLEDGRLDGRDIRLLAYLLSFVFDSRGRAWPGQKEMVAISGSVSAVRRDTRKLQRVGYLAVCRSGRRIEYSFPWLRAFEDGLRKVKDDRKQRPPVDAVQKNNSAHQRAQSTEMHPPVGGVPNNYAQNGGHKYEEKVKGGERSKARGLPLGDFVASGNPSPLSGGTENPEQGQGRGGDLSESVFEPSAVTALAVTDPFAPVSVFSADTVIPADTPEWCILGVFAALEVEANDGAVRPVTPRDRQHVRQFNTKFGIEMAVRILVYGIRNWKDFSTRNRITMPRTLGVIWKHSDALLAEALHGGPTGYIRTLQKDEVAAEQDRARQRMYAERGGPFLGFEALMGHRAPHPNAAAATRAIDALLSNLTELRPAQPALLAPVVERR